MDEFDLIRRYFAPLATSSGADGLRDDVAEIEADGRLIATTDTIVEGVHFLPSDPIDTVAAKLVRVNVSDIVAKGGRPDAALLMLTWPKGRDVTQLEAFAARLGEALSHWGARLVGGDTTSTKGPLTLSLTLLGRCSERGPVRRSGAKAGDDLWVTGVIGAGWLGLQAASGRLKKMEAADIADLTDCYRVPDPPPLAFADIVARVANGSIDVSDGLVADAGHIAAASGVELLIDWMDVPLGEVARRWLSEVRHADIRSLLTGGDDYQTLFTAPPGERAAIRDGCAAIGVRVSRIGRVEEGEGVHLVDASGAALVVPEAGWRHFADPGRAKP
ncbi:MAG: thiamine-phosphate kinase [Alphaproteobacteria bacterium]|nr:thiamine-phosphate kinase [Alphaproteobacteria bacterium]